jgi:hypothetical protein
MCLCFNRTNELTVPQILLMMVDLEDDPDWSVQDEIDDEDEDRLVELN